MLSSVTSTLPRGCSLGGQGHFYLPMFPSTHNQTLACFREDLLLSLIAIHHSEPFSEPLVCDLDNKEYCFMKKENKSA